MSNILALNLEEALGDIPIGLMAMKASLTLALADFEPASAHIRIDPAADIISERCLPFVFASG